MKVVGTAITIEFTADEVSALFTFLGELTDSSIKEILYKNNPAPVDSSHKILGVIDQFYDLLAEEGYISTITDIKEEEDAQR